MLATVDKTYQKIDVQMLRTSFGLERYLFVSGKKGGKDEK
jgi:hypothetical protein